MLKILVISDKKFSLKSIENFSSATTFFLLSLRRSLQFYFYLFLFFRSLFYLWTKLCFYLVSFLFYHFFRKLNKRFWNCLSIFDWSKEIRDVIFTAPLSYLFLCYLMLKIRLICDQNNLRRTHSICTHFEPFCSCMNKSLFMRKIENYDCALTSFKKWLNHGSISLLTGCIPNVEFYHFPINLKGLESEINSCYSCIGFFLIFILISELEK